MSNKITLYNSYCVKQIKQFEGECIDLTITSPPYDNLRTYNLEQYELDDIIVKDIYDYCQEYDRKQLDARPHMIR